MGKFYEGLGDELSLYVRMLAWLNTAPRAPERPGGKPTPKRDEDTRSRLERFQADGIEPDMPPLVAPWIVEHLMEIGPIESAGMGVAPIGWRTIHAWQEVTGAVLQPWEARLLHRLSAEYVMESRRAEKANCPAPWSDVPREDQRAAVSRGLSALFGGLARR